MRRREVIAGLAAAGLVPLAARGAEPARRLALTGGLLIDGYGGEPLEDSVVLIEGERIAAVGPLGHVPIPDDAEVISTEGMTVLPGLWDMAVYLSRLGHGDRAHWDELYLPLAQRVVMPLAMGELLAAGVTAVRDVQGPLQPSLDMRHRAEERLVPGPSVYAAGPSLAASAAGGARLSCRLEADDPAAARTRVAELLRAGVDLVTIAEPHALSPATLQAIVAAAQAGQSSAHALVTRDADLEPALSAGVDGLVGLGDGSGPWPGAALAALGSRLAGSRPLVVATAVSPPLTWGWLALDHEPLDDPRWRANWPALVADDVRGSLADSAALAAVYPDPAARRLAIAPRVEELLRAGVLLVAGSGAGCPAQLPGSAMAAEVEALVREAGLEPLEALRRATYWPAVACGRQHESGTVSAGKFADVIAVHGDVLRHIDRLADVDVVVRRGRRCR